MSESEDTAPTPPAAEERKRKSFLKRLNSPEASARAGVLAGALGVAAALIALMKS